MVGLLLASMGIYGTVSYIVVLRTREVGIRMALGAKKSDVLILMLRESTGPVVAGLIAGMVPQRERLICCAEYCMGFTGRWHLIRRRLARCFWPSRCSRLRARPGKPAAAS